MDAELRFANGVTGHVFTSMWSSKVLALKVDHPDAICGAGWAYAADKAGWDKAVKFLERCKTQSITTPQHCNYLPPQH